MRVVGMRVNARADSVADLLDDIDTGMMMRYVDELMDIEAAQEAIKGGNYGACVMCHGPNERLQTVNCATHGTALPAMPGAARARHTETAGIGMTAE